MSTEENLSNILSLRDHLLAKKERFQKGIQAFTELNSLWYSMLKKHGDNPIMHRLKDISQVTESGLLHLGFKGPEDVHWFLVECEIAFFSHDTSQQLTDFTDPLKYAAFVGEEYVAIQSPHTPLGTLRIQEIATNKPNPATLDITIEQKSR